MIKFDGRTDEESTKNIPEVLRKNKVGSSPNDANQKEKESSKTANCLSGFKNDLCSFFTSPLIKFCYDMVIKLKKLNTSAATSYLSIYFVYIYLIHINSHPC